MIKFLTASFDGHRRDTIMRNNGTVNLMSWKLNNLGDGTLNFNFFQQ